MIKNNQEIVGVLHFCKISDKKKKKLSKNHSKTASFKGLESNSKDLGNFFGVRKPSLIKKMRSEVEQRFYKSTKRSFMKTNDSLDFGSKILKLSQACKDKYSFRKNVMNLITDNPCSIFNFSKSDMRDIFRTFYEFFDKIQKPKEKKAPLVASKGV